MIEENEFFLPAGGFVMPGRVAFELGRILRMGEVRVRLRGNDRQVDRVLQAWNASALLHQETMLGSATGGLPRDSSADLVAPSAPMTTTEVAPLAECTTRSVRRAATHGRLHGEHVDGRWRFARDDVAAWIDSRTRR